jgi:hypothetical protein
MIVLWMVLSIFAFIISMVLVLHLAKTQIYANDEMVETSDNLTRVSFQQSFNDCIMNCEYDNICMNYCSEFYESVILFVGCQAQDETESDIGFYVRPSPEWRICSPGGYVIVDCFNDTDDCDVDKNEYAIRKLNLSEENCK